MSILVCGPCEYESMHKNAKKWCFSCEEGLCVECEKAHKSHKVSRNHKLISVEDYSKIADVNINTYCYHHDKKLDLFCKNHDVAVCLACVRISHKTCSDIITLDEASINAKRSTALEDLEQTIHVALQNVERITENRKLAKQAIDKQEQKIKGTTSDTKEKINKHLDKLEQIVLLEITKTSDTCRLEYEDNLKQLKSTENRLNDLKRQIQELKKVATNIQLFLGSRQINEYVITEIQKTKSFLSALNDYKIEYQVHPAIDAFLINVSQIGKLEISQNQGHFVYREAKVGQAQIHVPFPQYKSVVDTALQWKSRFTIGKKRSKPDIRGITTLSKNKVLIADYSSRLVEYNDIGKHIRDFSLSAEPFDLTKIDSDCIAVSYGCNNFVEVINLKIGKVANSVNFGKGCWGISFQDGKLYIIVDNTGIVVTDMTGKLLNTIDCDVDGVIYLTTTKDRIYYTDDYNHSVHCCSITGEYIWVFKENFINRPRGISVDNDQNVFVVGTVSNNLTLIQHDGKASKTLLTKDDGLDGPWMLFYSKDSNTLILNESRKTISLYSVT